MFRIALLALLSLAAVPARAERCADVLARIGSRLVDATCVASADLTTNNPATTPKDNSITSLPGGAFTPKTDPVVITPGPGNRTPITKVVPGIQIDGWLASDPSREARFLLRLPDDWNGKLVVAGASGTRSEFNGDLAWSDFVIQKGYAYASQNKGVLNLRVVSVTSANPPEPLACRVNPTSLSKVWVHFYDNDPEKPFWEWQFRIVEAARLAKRGVEARYDEEPSRTYAVGTSNGGYQVRRALELAPGVFDGGVDWEGTEVDSKHFNLLTDLPPAVKNFPAYVASDYNPLSDAAKAIEAAGYPPDIVKRKLDGSVATSLWAKYYGAYWEVTACQWQKRLDSGYDTYGSGLGNYDYRARAQVSPVAANLALFETSGRIHAPLITLAGTLDALLPIRHNARAYADKVAAASAGGEGEDDEDRPQYRLFEVQNGNHIETYKESIPELEYIQPHAQKAFDLLVDAVENGNELPPDQCIGRGGAIADEPAQPGRCAELLVK